MSEARISKGAESEQDAATPPDVMAAVERRFGPVRFDLAAHAGNTKHARYLAPARINAPFDPAKMAIGILVRQLMRAGARLDEAQAAVEAIAAKGKKATVSVANHDQNPLALDSFEQDWSALSQRYPAPDGGPGLGWLNPEFGNIDPWSEKSALEAARGANVVKLTPLSLGSNWWRDRCAGVADTYVLTGAELPPGKRRRDAGSGGSSRITFVGSTTPYPKDCMISHYHPGATGAIYLWDWRSDRIVVRWETAPSSGAELARGKSADFQLALGGLR
jgi:hypothetical protein